MKKFFVVALIAVALALASVACGDNDDDDPPVDNPKTQTDTITTSFGDITVTGFFTNAEWEGVPDKIKTELNTVYSQTTDGIKNTVSGKSVTIIVEKNPTYANYSTTRNGNTIRINFAIVNDADALLQAIGTSCALLGGLSAPEEG